MDYEACRQRLLTAFELHDAGVAIKRQQIRRKNPGWSETEVGKALQAWLIDQPANALGDVSGHVVVRILK